MTRSSKARQEVAAQQLTPRQRQAVEHPLAPLMILAGAGTGKTTTLIRRIAYLIEHHGVPPQRILALTFTEKAADELRNRINALTRRPGLTTATFHAFCYQAVLEFIPDYRARQLMTAGDALFLLREHYPVLTGLESSVFRREPPRAILAFKRFFDRLREELIDPARFPELLQDQAIAASREADDEGLELYRQLQDHCAVFPQYQRWKSEAGWVDYGDMVYECWRLLESRPRVLAALQDRYSTIIVDEFQDNNYALNVIVGRLAEKHLSVTVVGDDDQCIYAFRGASNYNLHDFRRRYRHHPHFAEIMLEENHRSTQPILNVANAVIAENGGRPDKRLKSSRSTVKGPDAGQFPTLAIGSSRAQLDYLATEISWLAAGGEVAPRDIAILTRTNRQAARVVAHLASRGIPSDYQNVSFFRLPAVRTALAWCMVTAGTRDAPAALHRLLREHGFQDPGAWQAAMEHLFGAENEAPSGQSFAGESDSAVEALITRLERLIEAAATENAAELVERVLVTSGLYRKHFRAGFREDFVAIANLNLFLQTAREFARRHQDDTLPRFIQYMAVMRDADALVARWPGTANSDAVHVMTVHAAKGREFPVVFLPNLQSGQFPLNYQPPREVADPPTEWRLWQSEAPLDSRASHVEEERRIFYVALTRARDRLTLLTTPQRQSPFVRNLPRDLVMEKALPEQASPSQPSGAADPLRAELTQRLSQELSRGAFEQAHQLVDALDLIGQHQAGQRPDFSDHPLGDELMQRLSIDDGSAYGPELQHDELTLSASGMASYETCPLQYRFARIERIPTRDTPYMRLGTIVHAVLEAFHQPGRTGPRPTMPELLEQAWHSDGFTFPQEEAQCREDAAALLATYLERLKGAEPPVVAVEEHFQIDLGDVQIPGIIDRVDQDEDGNVTVVDYKTSRRKLSEKEARQAPQLPMYALFLSQTDEIAGRPLGKGHRELLYHYLRSEEPEVRVSFSVEELANFRTRVVGVADAIRRGEFPYKTGYHCNYCDFKDLICPAWETPDGSPREEGDD